MKRKTIVRERNCFVRPALFRKAGVHRKSNKALRRQHNASIAQLVERLTVNQNVRGSSPRRRAKYAELAQW